MRGAYYNEHDPKAAAWLRELIKAGHIAPGDVDERSIVDVKAGELEGYTQCHFFAGIGIWSAALRLAGWPDDRPVWSGSCPCQDYSVAGKGEGAGGDRDLWPVFASLIRERKPDEIFGEQVSAAIRFGWLDRVRTDLEAEAYAVGGVVLGAHSAGADHIRQRLFWCGVDNSTGARQQPEGQGTKSQTRKQARLRGLECGRRDGGLANANGHEQGRESRQGRKAQGRNASCGTGGTVCGMADTNRRRREQRDTAFGPMSKSDAHGVVDGGTADTKIKREQRINGDTRGERGQGDEGKQKPGLNSTDGRLADVQRKGSQGHAGNGDDGNESGWLGAIASGPVAEGGAFNLWQDSRWHQCRDGKARRIPTEPRLFPLADARTHKGYRVAALRGAGNAINLGAAAAFITAAMESTKKGTQ